TSICRSSVTICSGLYFLVGIPALLQSEFSLTSAGTKNPGQVNLAAVRLAEKGFPISMSLIERSYRSLLAEGVVSLTMEPMKVEETPIRSRLTASEYNQMNIASIRQRYAQDKDFRQDVDELIKTGKVI
ncbi:MAG: hypothetical protein WA542_19005, partial [Candidatus Acidiferrum sp.]